MQEEITTTQNVPWNKFDLILTIITGILIIGLSLLISALTFIKTKIDPGIIVSVFELFFLFPVWFFGLRKYKANFSSLGFRRIPYGTMGLAFSLVIFSFFFNAIYATILAYFNLSVQGDLIKKFIDSSSSAWIWPGPVLVAPFVEEIFFRGFIFAGLRRYFDWRIAALISSALFAVSHVLWTSFLPLFLLGYIFAYLYKRSNSIWPSIIMHAVINGFGIGAVYMVKIFNLVK